MSFRQYMKVNILNNTDFKGYKNVVVNYLNDPDVSFMYMGMQLNNEGNNDLDKYIEIQKAINPLSPATEDIVTFTHAKYKNYPHKFYLNSMSLRTGEELKILKNKYDEKTYKEIERVTLKIFTFICALTKQLMNDNNIPPREIKGTASVLAKYIQSVDFLMSHKDAAMHMISSTLSNNIPPQLIAGKFNTKIQKMMNRFFI